MLKLKHFRPLTEERHHMHKTSEDYTIKYKKIANAFK